MAASLKADIQLAPQQSLGQGGRKPLSAAQSIVGVIEVSLIGQGALLILLNASFTVTSCAMTDVRRKA
ncbi:hypothetical protein [Paracoccus aminovorans]|uniref:hypothetical protein n=1 Tax=Paracoccus aminovorans TaxID=34004 RepID=UPI002B257474|nr:hypothetical protein [Paracoccus aminovorans]